LLDAQPDLVERVKVARAIYEADSKKWSKHGSESSGLDHIQFCTCARELASSPRCADHLTSSRSNSLGLVGSNSITQKTAQAFLPLLNRLDARIDGCVGFTSQSFQDSDSFPAFPLFHSHSDSSESGSYCAPKSSRRFGRTIPKTSSSAFCELDHEVRLDPLQAVSIVATAWRQSALRRLLVRSRGPLHLLDKSAALEIHCSKRAGRRNNREHHIDSVQTCVNFRFVRCPAIAIAFERATGLRNPFRRPELGCSNQVLQALAYDF
jgi:hypothetical protein